MVLYYLPSLFLLIAQFWYLYFVWNKYAGVTTYNSVVIHYSPFEAWRLKTGNVFFAAAASLAFPLSYWIFNFKKAIADRFQKSTMLYFLIAMLVFVLFIEKKTDGSNIAAYDFIWQVVIGVYLLFLASAVSLYKQFNTRDGLLLSRWMPFLVFLLHVISGVAYLVHIFGDRNWI